MVYIYLVFSRIFWGFKWVFHAFFRLFMAMVFHVLFLTKVFRFETSQVTAKTGWNYESGSFRDLHLGGFEGYGAFLWLFYGFSYGASMVFLGFFFFVGFIF